MATSTERLIATLYSEAWSVCNARYSTPNPERYLSVGLALYRTAMQEQIRLLFARSDEQNAKLDGLLTGRRSGGAVDPLLVALDMAA